MCVVCACVRSHKDKRRRGGRCGKSDMGDGEGEREEMGKTTGRVCVRHISTLAHCLAWERQEASGEMNCRGVCAHVCV